jgi:hypothetical protein
MKKCLILAPHFPPCNLAGVHRSRLFVKHLEKFGWKPIVLAVHEKHYEHKLDYDLLSLVDPELEIHKVDAFPLTKPRLIGDLGIRSFWQLYKKAKQLIRSESIDFVYIPIPSFYIALLGRLLHGSTGVAYGIDYIDPWVHEFPGSQKRFSRHWWSTRIAKWLEPIAVKHATLITGVAEGYYQAVLERNPHLVKQAVCGAMPYGGEVDDHRAVQQVKRQPYLFAEKSNKLRFVYAGAMLPKAYAPLERVFRVLSENPAWQARLEFQFIGTGSRVDDPTSYNIRPLAEQFGLWNSVVIEHPARIPYLDVLIHLEHADGVFILGSTEPHYTPSKSYQGVLSGKPILAILHNQSTAVKVLRDSNAAIVLDFAGEAGLDHIERQLASVLEQYLTFHQAFDPKQVRMDLFHAYSAQAVTQTLALLLDEAEEKSHNKV